MSELDGLKLLKRIEEGVAGKTGDAFFRQIIVDLTGALGAYAAFAAQLNSDRTASMLAFHVGDHFEACTTYKLEGTPCEFVYAGRITAYARDIGNVFPVDRDWFASLGVNSYIGIPFKGETGEVFGHLAVMDTRERDWHEADVDVLRLFSLRSAGELERMRYHRRLEHANTELRAARLAAESANQAKSVFISNMSHELRTPLNGILGYAQLLRQDDATLRDDQREGLAVIERSGEHLLTLINDLLDLAKIEAGKLEVHKDDVDLDGLLGDVCDLARMRAKAAGLEFRFEAGAGTLQAVRADARALRQVLLNLLGNAVKFTERGGRVALSVASDALAGTRRKFTFQVSDTGIGIPENEIEHIFEPFHRVIDSSRPVEGTGLGLSITRRLTEAMGGEVHVISRIGAGSTFVVTLEFDAAVAPLRPAAEARVRGYEGAKRSVVVADDDEVNRTIIARLLSELGFEVRVANNGREALDLTKLKRPDALITDLLMPVLDGMQLVHALRADEKSPRLPIIALSASASRFTEQEALAGGCDAFLAKPVRLADLLEHVRRLLELNWRYADTTQAEASIAGTANGERVLLDPVIAGQLNEFAMRGDVIALMALADQSLGQDPAARTLHSRIRSLADQYDMRGIRRVLSACQNA